MEHTPELSTLDTALLEKIIIACTSFSRESARFAAGLQERHGDYPWTMTIEPDSSGDFCADLVMTSSDSYEIILSISEGELITLTRHRGPGLTGEPHDN